MIPNQKPTYDEQTKKELLEVLDSGWVGNGPKVIEFEKKFAEYVGAKYAVATNSATSALDLCLKVYDIKDGELITTPMTFVSDAIVGEWNGMDVTFADIDPRTLCIDPASIKVNPNTKAIIVVDSHGRLADIPAIRAKFDGLIIEDAAHACFTPGAGKHADITVWSFQAVKTLPIFDGGMITTNDEQIAKKLKTLTWLGIERSTYERVGKKGYAWEYDITHSGIKAYMTDVQAVLGIGQLRRLEIMNQRRREIQEKYNKAFEGNSWFKAPEYSHTVQYYTPEWRNRDELAEFLAEKEIHTSVHFKPLSEITYWKKAVKNPLPNTEVWRNLLSLPVHYALTDGEQNYIIKSVKEFYTPKILITGGTGRLAAELKKHLEGEYVGIEHWDFTKQVPRGEYDLILHMGAYTDVKMAEQEKEKCMLANVMGTFNMVNTYKDTPFIYISSEYALNPLGVYALSKQLGEEVVKTHPNHLILRTLFKPNPFPFDKAYIDQYTQGDYIDVIAKMVADIALKWDQKTSNSIYVGTGRKTIFELAKKTRPDVLPNSVDDYNKMLGMNLIPKDYM